MKNEDLNQRSRTDFEWNWINQHRGHYNKQDIRNFIGSERIRVTFSDKMDDAIESAIENPKNKNHYTHKMNVDSEKKEKDSRIPQSEKPEKEIDNNQTSLPEKGDGGEFKKEKPEIRYDLD